MHFIAAIGGNGKKKDWELRVFDFLLQRNARVSSSSLLVVFDKLRLFLHLFRMLYTIDSFLFLRPHPRLLTPYLSAYLFFFQRFTQTVPPRSLDCHSQFSLPFQPDSSKQLFPLPQGTFTSLVFSKLLAISYHTLIQITHTDAHKTSQIPCILYYQENLFCSTILSISQCEPFS